jgi:hypothetical protein
MQFYSHSGKLGKRGVLWALVSGLVVGLVLCRYYVRALCWMPVVYLNPFITIAYGSAVGAATAIGAKLGHLRNLSVALLLGVLTGLAALYFAWAYDPLARIGVFEEPVWDSDTLWAYMKLLYAHGSGWLWPGGPTISGVPLVAVWLVEAAVIVGLSAQIAHRWLIDQPYCEESERWMKREKNVARLALDDGSADNGVDAKLQRLSEGDLSVLAELPRATGKEAAQLQLDLASIEECSFCQFLTVTLIEQVASEHGRVRTQKRRLLDKLHVMEEELPLIREAGKELVAD